MGEAQCQRLVHREEGQAVAQNPPREEASSCSRGTAETSRADGRWLFSVSEPPEEGRGFVSTAAYCAFITCCPCWSLQQPCRWGKHGPQRRRVPPTFTQPVKGRAAFRVAGRMSEPWEEGSGKAPWRSF